MKIRDIDLVIKDLGIPSTIYVNSIPDLILIQPFQNLSAVHVVINATRYKKNTVTLRFSRKKIVEFKEETISKK